VPPARAASPVPAEPAGSDSSIEVIVPSAANVPGRIRGGGPSETDEQVIRESDQLGSRLFVCYNSLATSSASYGACSLAFAETRFLSVVNGRILSSFRRVRNCHGLLQIAVRFPRKCLPSACGGFVHAASTILTSMESGASKLRLYSVRAV
jgi:hypothetical protein